MSMMSLRGKRAKVAEFIPIKHVIFKATWKVKYKEAENLSNEYPHFTPFQKEKTPTASAEWTCMN